MEGAKAARKALQQLQKCLNAPDVVPEQCYRMNSATYPLVCYINQLTALFLSGNYPVIPIFLDRAYRALTDVPHARVSDVCSPSITWARWRGSLCSTVASQRTSAT